MLGKCPGRTGAARNVLRAAARKDAPRLRKGLRKFLSNAFIIRKARSYLNGRHVHERDLAANEDEYLVDEGKVGTYSLLKAALMRAVALSERGACKG